MDTTKTVEKGTYMGNCNRTACQKPGAEYYNHSTQKYYCEECAESINLANWKDAQRLFGHALCTRSEHKIN